MTFDKGYNFVNKVEMTQFDLIDSNNVVIYVTSKKSILVSGSPPTDEIQFVPKAKNDTIIFRGLDL